MILAKNYEAVSKFVKVMPILWPLFSGHGVVHSFFPQRDLNPRPPAVRHESQVCYHSATQSAQFDVSFPQKHLKIVATVEARFLA